MAICKERPRQTAESHYLRPGSTREYTISGTTSRLTAQLALLNTSPSTDTGIDTVGNTIVIYRGNMSVREEGGGVWTGVVRYEATADTTELNFSFGTVSGKIFHALQHIRTYDLDLGIESEGENGQAVIYDGVIGVNGDEIEGVEIEFGNVEFSITKKAQIATLSNDYIQTIVELMGGLGTPVNDGTWAFVWKGLTFDFPEGSLRLRSVPIKWTGNDEIEISYHFHYSRPIFLDDAFRFPGTNGPDIQKEGHEYGWPEYRLVTENNRTKRKLIAYHVEQVYPKADFNVLEI